MAQEPTLAEVLKAAIDARIAEVHTSLPAKVVEFNPGPPAMVKVSLGLDFHRLGDDGRRERYAPPQLAEIPVVYPSAGDYSLTFPLSAGDYVLLVFAERALTDWLRSGGAHVEPQHARRHHFTDAIAIPGFRPRNADVPAAGHDPDAMVLRVPGGKSIKLGGTATKGVNREGDTVIAESALATFTVQTVTALQTIAAAVPVVIVPPTLITTATVIGETGPGSSVVKADD